MQEQCSTRLRRERFAPPLPSQIHQGTIVSSQWRLSNELHSQLTFTHLYKTWQFLHSSLNVGWRSVLQLKLLTHKDHCQTGALFTVTYQISCYKVLFWLDRWKWVLPRYAQEMTLFFGRSVQNVMSWLCIKLVNCEVGDLNSSGTSIPENWYRRGILIFRWRSSSDKVQLHWSNIQDKDLTSSIGCLLLKAHKCPGSVLAFRENSKPMQYNWNTDSCKCEFLLASVLLHPQWLLVTSNIKILFQ